jgi:aspartokinase-like uncharacterized kinase
MPGDAAGRDDRGRAVVKLGGSLLARRDAPERIAALLDHWSPGTCVLIIGGGDAADLVRRWGRQFSLSEETCHWLALRSLRLTEALLCALLPDVESACSRDEVESLLTSGRRPVLALEPLLRSAEQTGERALPHCWDVTTDSLAAWATQWLGAERLVLVKSCPPPVGGAREAAEAGLVDSWFPRSIQGIEAIDWVDLSAGGSLTVHPWLCRGVTCDQREQPRASRSGEEE